MKNYLIALLLAMGLMSTQSASAAMLTLTQMLDSGVVTMGSGTTVKGSSLDDPTLNPTNTSIWKLELSDLGPSGLADLRFCLELAGPLSYDMSFTGPGFKNLAADTYYLSLFPKVPNISYDFKFSVVDAISQVPVPATVWLFGSALLGLIGITTRKSQPMFAA